MTEQTSIQNIEISLPRLLLAATATMGELPISIEKYLSHDLDHKKMMLDLDEDQKTFVVRLVDKEDEDHVHSEGENNEPGPTS
jgi:hypothetical protein